MSRPNTQLADLLHAYAQKYNRPEFIADDPISVPHRFSRQQDIEIMAFFAAILAWGQRKTIIAKCKELAERFNGEPYQFILQHQEQDLKQLEGFKHRTFNDTDLLYCVHFLQTHYNQHHTLADAFFPAPNVQNALIRFRQYFFSLPNAPARTQKHIASPQTHSACKRLNMFLRWMVRRDNCGVDFGLWQHISPAQLICPLDVHVERVARKLQLLQRPQTDWQAAQELTAQLRLLDPNDPVRFDYALFGLGLEGFGK